MRDDFGIVTGRARETCACAELELDIVDERARRDLAERHAVARLYRRVLADDEGIAHLHVLRREHVAALTVSEHDAGDEASTVRIVLDGLDACRDILLVVLEVDVAETALVAAALVADRDASAVRAAGAVLLRGKKALHRLVA